MDTSSPQSEGKWKAITLMSLIGIILRWGFLIWELIFLFIADFLSSSW